MKQSENPHTSPGAEQNQAISEELPSKLLLCCRVEGNGLHRWTPDKVIIRTKRTKKKTFSTEAQKDRKMIQDVKKKQRKSELENSKMRCQNLEKNCKF